MGLAGLYGSTAAGAARGLALRMDHGSQYLSDHFTNQIKFWGIQPSYAFVAEPQTNGVAERFNVAEGTDHPWSHLPQHRESCGTPLRLRRTLQCPVIVEKNGYLDAPLKLVRRARRDLNQARRGDKLVSKEPGALQAQLAIGLYMTNDLNRAVRELDEALRLAPNNQEVNVRAIQILAYIGEYERSNALMDDLKKMNPNYPPWLNWMPAYAHLARGENTEAIALLEMTQMGWQDWTRAFIAAAHCLNGDIAEGQASLEVALEPIDLRNDRPG